MNKLIFKILISTTLLSSFLFADKSLTDVDKSSFLIDKSKLTEVLKDIASDLIEVKKEQFKIAKKIEKLQEKGYKSEKKLKIMELIIDEQKGIIKDLIFEIDKIQNPKPTSTLVALNDKQEKNHKKEKPKKSSNKESFTDKVQSFQPTTYILTKRCDVYSTLDSNIIDSWAGKKRFTSYKGNVDFVKVSGEIISGKWKKVKQNIFVNRECIREYK